MPDITMNWDVAGLVLPVAIGPSLKTIQGLQAAGQPIPSSVEVRGLIDSGSDICVISPLLVQHFAFPISRLQTTLTTLGTQRIALFEISLVVMGPTGLSGPTLVQSNLDVMGSPQSFSQQIDVLIGLDILRLCVLHADGPSTFFTLSF